jgi:hypothetical protein
MKSSLTSLNSMCLCLLLAFGVAATLARPLQYQPTTVKLIDATFEDQTQAATGQTTGSWLLWFYQTGDRTEIDGEQPTQEFFDDHHIVVGAVNDVFAPDTVERFQLTKLIPVLLFLHRGKFFQYKGTNDWESIVDYVQGGYRNDVAQTVPPPKSEFQKVLKTLSVHRGLFLCIGLSFVLFVIALYMTFVVPHHRAPKKKLT